jgi:hypothetical protein
MDSRAVVAAHFPSQVLSWRSYDKLILGKGQALLTGAGPGMILQVLKQSKLNLHSTRLRHTGRQFTYRVRPRREVCVECRRILLFKG